MAREADEREIRALLGRLEDPWNAADGGAFASPSAPDADFTVFNGKRLSARDEIARDHAHAFATGKKDTTATFAVERLRFLQADAAFVHLGDRLAVLETLARADAAADAKDVGGLAALYAPDGHITGAYHVRPGSDFAGDMEKVFGAEGTLKRHVTVSPIIEGDGDRAAGRAKLLVFEGEQAPVVVATCLSRDDLRRVDPGMKINAGQKS